MKTPTTKTALFDMRDAPQGGEKAMRAYRRTDLSLCSYNGQPGDYNGPQKLDRGKRLWISTKGVQDEEQTLLIRLTHLSQAAPFEAMSEDSPTDGFGG
jgi:hypothetical protein